MQGLRKIELKVPIITHERIKQIAKDANNMSVWRATNILLAMGIKEFDKQKKAAEGEEPDDMEVGD